MPDDHSDVVPLLPIPNRTVKRLCADDSADSRVKVGHRQAIKPENALSSERAFFSENIGDVADGSEENVKRFQDEEIHAIIQGFADHGEVSGKKKNEWQPRGCCELTFDPGSLKIYSR